MRYSLCWRCLRWFTSLIYILFFFVGCNPGLAEDEACWPDQLLVKGTLKHRCGISSLVLDQRGKAIIAGAETDLAIWGIYNENSLAIITKPELSISSMSLSPDGKFLAVGNWDGMLEIWDMTTRTKKMSTPPHEGGVTSVTWSPDGAQLATASEDHGVRLIDTKTYKSVNLCGAHDGAVNAIAFSPDNRYFASGGDDMRIKIWSPNGDELMTLDTNSAVLCIAISPDGKFLSSGENNGSINIWEILTGKVARELHRYKGKVFALIYACNGKRIITGGSDKNIRVWNALSGRMIMEHEGTHLAGIRALEKSESVRCIYSADEKGQIVIWGAPVMCKN